VVDVATPMIRMGMLTPSSNTVLEPLTAALLTPIAHRASAHFGRFRVTRIGLDDAADAQFAQEAILAAAGLLADARPAVIAWNGTAASWLGFDRDVALCAAITERTGAPAASAVLGLNALLDRLGIRRLGLVTPYTADVQARIAANYARIGVAVTAERHCGLSDNFSFCEVDEARIADLCRAVAAEGADAIAIVCTNMRGALVAPALEAELGMPVLDSVSVTLWAALRAAGASTAELARFGRLFAV
jgi:maleate isomerase